MSSLVQLSGKVPVLETERLRLRGHRPEDFAPSASMWADPNVTRYIGGTPLSQEEVWARLLRYVGHWHWMGFGYWLVEEKTTGSFAGEVGFADWKRDITPSLIGVPELGWVLPTRVHGQGYATEAARAALAWADSRLADSSAESVSTSLGRTVCIIHPEHVRSIRVAQKCGFHEVLRTTYHGEPTILFARL